MVAASCSACFLRSTFRPFPGRFGCQNRTPREISDLFQPLRCHLVVILRISDFGWFSGLIGFRCCLGIGIFAMLCRDSPAWADRLPDARKCGPLIGQIMDATLATC